MKGFGWIPRWRKGQTPVVLAGLGLSELLFGVFLVLSAHTIEAHLQDAFPEIPPHRIELLGAVIVRLYFLLGLALVTIGCFLMRHRIRVGGRGSTGTTDDTPLTTNEDEQVL